MNNSCGRWKYTKRFSKGLHVSMTPTMHARVAEEAKLWDSMQDVVRLALCEYFGMDKSKHAVKFWRDK